MRNQRKLITLFTSAAVAGLMLSGCSLFPSQHHGHVESSEPTERDAGDKSEDAGTKRVVKHPAKESLPSRGSIKKVDSDTSKPDKKNTSQPDHSSKNADKQTRQKEGSNQASNLEKQEASDSEDSLQMGRWHVHAYASTKAEASQQIKQFDDWAQSHKLPVPSDEGSIQIIGSRAIVKWSGKTKVGPAENVLDGIAD